MQARYIKEGDSIVYMHRPYRVLGNQAETGRGHSKSRLRLAGILNDRIEHLEVDSNTELETVDIQIRKARLLSKKDKKIIDLETLKTGTAFMDRVPVERLEEGDVVHYVVFRGAWFVTEKAH